MGCFSYKCKVCEKGINSTSFEGELVELFQLKDGKVIQHMDGEYDSYGRVFIDGSQDPRVSHPLRESFEWDMDWHECCQLHFNENPNDGFAAIHTTCWNGEYPTTQSEDDPDQGWNELNPKHRVSFLYD